MQKTLCCKKTPLAPETRDKLHNPQETKGLTRKHRAANGCTCTSGARAAGGENPRRDVRWRRQKSGNGEVGWRVGREELGLPARGRSPNAAAADTGEGKPYDRDLDFRQR
jgi:hypothetical protein